VYGRLVPLSDGSLVRADDRYLRDSILQPQREIAAGFEPIMPTFAGVLSENELLDLLTYLRSLRDERPPVVVPQPVPTLPPGRAAPRATPVSPPAP
jgi:cytochrome c oxidase subunit 2